jgi:hypothetical protein
MKYIAFLAASLFAGFATAEQCTAIFPGGIQSHSASGFIQMGYETRVYGSGPTLVAPTVTHTHSWQDQVGLCDGVKCRASGTHAATSTPTFLTGSQVPTTFQSGNASGGELVTGYRAQPLYKSAGDYGRVEVGQASIIGFTSVGGTYLMKGVKTNDQSTLEFSSGDYWIDGDLDLRAQDSIVRRIGEGDGAVRLFVRGDVRAGQIKVEGFAAGQIAIYATGSVNFGNGLKLPGFIYANGSVYLGTEAEVTGGVYSNNFSTNSSPIIRYTQVNHDHKMGTLTPAYDSTFELAPGNYWIDGDLTAKVATKIRKLPGEGKVRLFVRGNIEIQHAAVFENFGGGDLLMYATGDITIRSQKDLPAFVYAAGDVTIEFSNNGRYKGGITGRNVYIGQGSIVEYMDPTELGPLCEAGGTVAQIDHFEFTTSALAHTCSPQTVTLMACTNATPGACQPYQGDVSVTLRGDGWLGGNQQTLRGGVGTFKLQGLQLQMPLAVDASEPDASPLTLCRIGDAPLSSACLLNFAQSGFIFDVPDMQAGRVQSGVPMRAVIDVGDEGSPRCEPAFTDSTREVRFWSSFVTPSVSELSDSSKQVQVNAESVGQNLAEARPLALRFDQNGATSLDVNYAEAGRMLLNAYYPGSAEEGDSGPMSGSDDFVSTPAGFCIEPSQTCSAGDSSCDVFRKVGQAFSTTIRPVAWRADGELCKASTTRNYRQDQLQLRPVVLAPSPVVGGVAGQVLTPVDGSYDHLPSGSPANWDGTVVEDVALSEVGVFRLRVEPPPYLGVAVPASDSAPIGRFIPRYLKASIEGALKAGCGVFSYQDQPVAVTTPPALTITGYGVADGAEYRTENYDFDGFWGFASSPVPSWLAAGGNLDLTPRLDQGKGMPEALTWQSIKDLVPSQSGDNDGDGQRTYTWDAGWLRYLRAEQPDADDHPFQMLLRFTAQELTDRDGVCNGSGCQDSEAILDQSEFRLGRLRIGNGHGSELQDLSLPWVIETWQASNIFLPEGGDTCSAPIWGNAQAFEQVGNLASKSLQIEGGQTGYEGSLVIGRPEATGEARIGFANVPEWLWYDWQGKGLEPSRGLATFGIYQGPKPLIFRREVYR